MMKKIVRLISFNTIDELVFTTELKSLKPKLPGEDEEMDDGIEEGSSESVSSFGDDQEGG